MSKTTGFPGRNAISPQRGGWQGGSNMQNSREIRGSKRSKGVHFERILVQIVRVQAHLSSFSSNPGANVTEKDHFRSGERNFVLPLSKTYRVRVARIGAEITSIAVMIDENQQSADIRNPLPVKDIGAENWLSFGFGTTAALGRVSNRFPPEPPTRGPDGVPPTKPVGWPAPPTSPVASSASDGTPSPDEPSGPPRTARSFWRDVKARRPRSPGLFRCRSTKSALYNLLITPLAIRLCHARAGLHHAADAPAAARARRLDARTRGLVATDRGTATGTNWAVKSADRQPGQRREVALVSLPLGERVPPDRGRMQAGPADPGADLSRADPEFTERVNAAEAADLDDEFVLGEFLDRFGIRLSQLGNILGQIAPLADAAPTQTENG